MRARVPARFVALIAAAAALLAGVGPSTHAAHAADPSDGRRVHAVGVRTAVLTDPTRPTPAVDAIGLAASPGRELPITVWYPARGPATATPTPDARPATGRFPVVVWAHGNSAHGSTPPPVVPMWASYGYVVVAPDFPVSSRARALLDAQPDWPAQPADVRFLLDRVLEPGATDLTGARVDARRVGLAGHSLGAITVLAEAYGPDPDPRVDAVISLSGIAALPDTEVASRPTPLLLVHADDDRTVPYAGSTQLLDAASGPATLLTVVGGGHSPYLYGTDPTTMKVLATATLAFWDGYLRGDRRALDRIPALALPGRFEVQTRGASDVHAATTAATTKTAKKKATCPTDGSPVRDVRYARVKGVDPSLLSVDVYPVATGCPSPVVVWVHGGGWQVGDKRNQMADKVAHWNELGYTVVSVNYRLTDPAVAEPVRFPTHNEDVAAAVAWVHDRIARYGGDPDRIALLGHSAGAQIAASVATDPEYLLDQDLSPDALRCVAPLDTEGFDVAGPASTGNPVYLEVFGTDPGVWARASPQTHVASTDAGVPPHLVVRRGTPARRRLLDRYVAVLGDYGVPVTVVDGIGLTHGDVNRLIGAPGDTRMTPPLDAFLADCFAGPGPSRGFGGTPGTTAGRA